MTNDLLGPLPEPAYMTPMESMLFNAAQMRAYAAQRVAAERERCALAALSWGETHDPAETVNARNASRKIAYAIQGPNAELTSPQREDQ